ncbi:hypothetical protein RchiOBHm_Chr6g0285281 [Rosa chinensis]|uniref:Uncharacterized protein n=1 Tax=Rosa chinensis TaxID=74649 RepID=A0A2P6PUH3_ROSCH|nr:hypothetical protein RchiOBHm_Chr6g0285281 [Rosa chinensis]
MPLEAYMNSDLSSSSLTLATSWEYFSLGLSPNLHCTIVHLGSLVNFFAQLCHYAFRKPFQLDTIVPSSPGEKIYHFVERLLSFN